MSNTNKPCPEFPHFGARYPDATCIDGYLWDLDKCNDDGTLYGGGDEPAHSVIQSCTLNKISKKNLGSHAKKYCLTSKIYVNDMEGNNKPLTAEEFFDQNKIEVDEEWIGTNMIPISSFNHCMLAYAAQQAAWKDARIAELEENYRQLAEDRDDYKNQTAALREELSRIMELCGVQHVNGEGGALVAVGYVLKERQELLAWKKSQLEVFGPLLDFGQSKESGIQIGDSIVQEAINALKERKSLREELEDVKQRIYAPPITRGQIERRADELGNTYRMKLEEGQAARRGYLLGYQDAIEQVEAVKKERDDFAKMVDREVIAKNKAQYQRDEAVKLLGKAHDLIEGDLHEFMTREERATCMDIRQGFERLSSGETKPVSTTPDEYPGKAYQPLFDHMSKEHNLTLLESEMQEIIEIVRKMDSPWISVEDRLPERGQIVDIYCMGEDKYCTARITRSDVKDFVTWSKATHWRPQTPLPAHPESLTDKK